LTHRDLRKYQEISLIMLSFKWEHCQRNHKRS